MAKTIYYDSVGLLEATITAGTHSGTTFTVSASAVTNEHYIIDQSIAQAVTSYDLNDMIRIDLGSSHSGSIDFLLHHNKSTSDETDNLGFFNADHATATGSRTHLDTTTTPEWNIQPISNSSRYQFIQSQEGGFAGLTEIIIGTKLEFENEPDIGIATQEIFGTDLNTSLGGVEYANKRHEPKTTFQLNFSNISQTFKNNLVSFEQDVTNFKKFVYYDDSNYHYVRLDSPIKFTEVAFQRFSASLKLREQLS